VCNAHDEKLERRVTPMFLPQQITVIEENKARFLQEPLSFDSPCPAPPRIEAVWVGWLSLRVFVPEAHPRQTPWRVPLFGIPYSGTGASGGDFGQFSRWTKYKETSWPESTACA